MRAFVAIDPDETNRNNFATLAEHFNNLYEGNPVKKQNYHLTLFFFGDIGQGTLDKVKMLINELNASAFNIKLDHIDCFYFKHNPRVCFLGGTSTTLEKLYNTLKMQFKNNYISFDDKPFKIHITLFRIKYIKNMVKFTKALKELNNNFKPLNFMVNNIILYNSILTKSGPIYNANFIKQLNS